ncbi:hypothetical protein MSSD14B_01550 [Marinobacter salsuginis]|uniref:Uncharacterized protein n=1 Tax=Marinobacter salsuginis TaxID=418719 RepID=A0A5M3PUG5_9GAMM|nr:hypothetical protein MS5N3_21500 [Marinobacter salsuginis]GBO86487.1 hypothetical protein MSSD14B_01550 [Marinobacter salsuginis]
MQRYLAFALVIQTDHEDTLLPNGFQTLPDKPVLSFTHPGIKSELTEVRRFFGKQRPKKILSTLTRFILKTRSKAPGTEQRKDTLRTLMIPFQVGDLRRLETCVRA